MSYPYLGINYFLSDFNNPALSTSPSGVGTKYKNITDGKIFICTDATAGANVYGLM
jgi:hypothetical protein